MKSLILLLLVTEAQASWRGDLSGVYRRFINRCVLLVNDDLKRFEHAPIQRLANDYLSRARRVVELNLHDPLLGVIGDQLRFNLAQTEPKDVAESEQRLGIEQMLARYQHLETK